MVALKFCILVIILSVVVLSFEGEAAPASKKSRQHLKPKKSNHNNKAKATFKKAPSQPAVVANRNAKMNMYHSRSWPSTNSFYHAPSMPLYLRSAPSTMYYPNMRWSSPYLSSPSMMSNYLRRSDDIPSMSTMTSMPTDTPMSQMMSLNGGQTPTILDMSAFTGSGMMDNSYPSQSLWSMSDMSGPSTPKSKFNLFNSFSLNDDGGLFGGLFNQFK